MANQSLDGKGEKTPKNMKDIFSSDGDGPGCPFTFSSSSSPVLLIALAPGAELLYYGIWRLGGYRHQRHKLSEPTAVGRVEEWWREGLWTPREEELALGFLLTFLML
ncbi:unnamed protein product [Pleuronectes platessa]|uniref:Uncharacterized protein n=1 Tax=Pleuronectes platessa TaxID=8262 RepID=A0A9N7TLP4_PLEPL|nr:unnamed protein product [Pleuronectes platessa]